MIAWILRGRLWTGLWLGLLLTGCSGFPRLVVLHDPLSAEEHIKLGVAYEEKGDWDRALAEYQAALKKDRRHLQALVNIGNVYTQQHRYREAERSYRKALKLDRSHPMANNNLAWILVVQGTRLKEAERLIQKAVESDPGRSAVYLDTRAHLYLRQGRLKEALASVEEAEGHLSGEDQGLRSHLALTRGLITRAMESGPPASIPAADFLPEDAR